MKPTRILEKRPARSKTNRKTHVYECDNGVTYTRDELLKACGLNKNTVHGRIKVHGLTSPRVLAPVKRKKPEEPIEPKKLTTRSGKEIPANTKYDDMFTPKKEAAEGPWTGEFAAYKRLKPKPKFGTLKYTEQLREHNRKQVERGFLQEADFGKLVI